MKLFLQMLCLKTQTALSEYNPGGRYGSPLHKLISRAAFISMTLDERKAFASWVVCPEGTKNPLEEKDR